MVWKSQSPMSNPIEDYLTPEEVAAIIAQTRKPRDALLFKLLYMTGRRVSEIVGDSMTNSDGLKVQDIDFKQGLINFIILKKNPIRKKGLPKNVRLMLRKDFEPARVLLPVNTDLLTELKIYCISLKDDKLFRVSRPRVHQIFNECAKRAGLDKKVHIHQLRHSFAVRIAKKSKNPADLETLRVLLGHSDINMTRAYLKFSPKDMQKLVDEI